MEAAAREGMRPSEFWRTTPRELTRFLRGRNEADKRALAFATITAWKTANWSKAKKLPDLNKELRRIAGKRRTPQTPEQALRVAEALNRQFGGKDLRQKRE